MKPPKPLYSYMAAATLALVTLFTFYAFRDFGPQSVIRRFHIDVARANDRDLNAVTTEGVNSASTEFMKQRVLELIGANASFEVVNLRRQHHEVLASVEYRFPNGSSTAITWHVVQTPVDWRIDCRATALEMLRRLEPSR